MDGGEEKTGSDQKVGVLRKQWQAMSLANLKSDHSIGNGLKLLADILSCLQDTKEILQL